MIRLHLQIEEQSLIDSLVTRLENATDWTAFAATLRLFCRNEECFSDIKTSISNVIRSSAIYNNPKYQRSFVLENIGLSVISTALLANIFGFVGVRDNCQHNMLVNKRFQKTITENARSIFENIEFLWGADLSNNELGCSVNDCVVFKDHQHVHLLYEDFVPVQWFVNHAHYFPRAKKCTIVTSYLSSSTKWEALTAIFLNAKHIVFNIPEETVRTTHKFAASTATFTSIKALNQFHRGQFPELESVHICSSNVTIPLQWGFDLVDEITLHNHSTRRMMTRWVPMHENTAKQFKNVKKVRLFVRTEKPFPIPKCVHVEAGDVHSFTLVSNYDRVAKYIERIWVNFEIWWSSVEKKFSSVSDADKWKEFVRLVCNKEAFSGLRELRVIIQLNGGDEFEEALVGFLRSYFKLEPTVRMRANCKVVCSRSEESRSNRCESILKKVVCECGVFDECKVECLWS